MLLKLFTKYKSFYKDTLKLAIPVIIAQLGHTLVAFSDSVIIGRTGKIPLAACALANSLFMIFMMIGIGISYGLTPLIAQANGRKNFAFCGKLLAHSLGVNLFIGILLYATINTGMHFLDRLGQPPEVLPEAVIYMHYLALSVIPLMLYLTFKQFAEGLGFTRQSMNITIVGNVINIVLGIVLVFGYLGFKPMGIAGIGISTLVDRMIMGVAMAFYVFRSPSFSKYLTGFSFKKLDFKVKLQILKIGIPVSMQYVFEVSAFGGAVVLMGWLGAKAQAAHQIAINLASMTYMLASGIASAAAVKTGTYFGAKDFVNLRLSAISSYHICMAFMTCTAILFITCRHLLPLLYVHANELEVINMAAGLLLLAGLFQLSDGVQVIGLGVLRGIGDVFIPTCIAFAGYWIIGLPVGYCLAFNFGLGANGVWWGLLIGLAVVSILLYWRFNYRTKKISLVV